MIIICEECGKKYKIDSAKLKKTTRFKCKNCSHQIIVQKQPEADVKPAPVSPVTTSTKKNTEPVHNNNNESLGGKKYAESLRTRGLRIGLTPKLFIILIFVSLIPLTAFRHITVKQTETRVRNNTKKQISTVAGNIAKQIDKWHYQNLRALKALSKIDSMISMDRGTQESLLEAYTQLYPGIDTTITINNNGIKISGIDKKSLQNYSNQDYSKTPFYKKIINGSASAVQTGIDKTTGKPVMIAAVPIKNNNMIVGVLAVSFKIRDVLNRLITWEGGDTGFAFLIDAKGLVIARSANKHPVNEKNMKNHPLIASYFNGARGPISFIDKNNNQYIGFVSGIKNGWAVAIGQEESEIFDALDMILSYNYLLFGVTIVFICIIAWFAGRALTRPILKLTDAADRISVGELEMEIKIKRNDEIGELADAISRMQDSLRLSIERLRRRK